MMRPHPLYRVTKPATSHPRDSVRVAPVTAASLRGPKDIRTVLALQRLAGNAAVADALRRRTAPPSVQRCGGDVHPGCPCADERSAEYTPVQRMRSPLVVQRADIDFRTLTWADFKGPKPAKFPAKTVSGIRALPTLKQVKDTKDTGADCTPPKAKKTEFTVKISVDPTMFDNIKAFFSQEKSGADPDAKKGFASAAAAVVKDCQANFDKVLKDFKAQAAKDCLGEVGPCKQAFKDGNTSFTFTIGGSTVTVTSAKECSSKLVTGCKAATLASFKPGKFTWTHTPGGSVEAASKADCTAGFKTSVTAIEKAEAARLLNHEQIHFNVTNSIATKLQADLRATAAGIVVQVTECGKSQALAKAVKDFEALGGAAKLKKLFEDAVKELDATQSDYDTSTSHGLIQKEQDKWNKKFP